MAKTALNKNARFTRNIDLKLRKKLGKRRVSSITLYGAET
jgi:hypothetical protein